MTAGRDTLSILQAIDSGDLDVDQAIQEIEAAELEAESADAPEVSTPREWFVLLASAIGLAIGGALLGYLGGWWWLLGAPLLMLGGLLILLALASYRAPWLRLRVRSGTEGRTIAFRLPLPVGWAAWGVRLAQAFVPGPRRGAIDELLRAMPGEFSPNLPPVVDVAERGRRTGAD